MKVRRVLLITGCLVLLDGGLTAAWVGRHVLPVPSSEETTDAAVLFMGDFDVRQRTLGSQSLRRTHDGAELFRRGRVKRILCAGGARPDRGVFASLLMKKRLVESGVPDAVVDTDRKSFDTVSNWQVARVWMSASGMKSVRLVSSAVHLPRIRRTVEEQPLAGVKIYFATCAFKACSPPETWADIWQQVHYEWLAQAARAVLGDRTYRNFLRRMRR